MMVASKHMVRSYADKRPDTGDLRGCARDIVADGDLRGRLAGTTIGPVVHVMLNHFSDDRCGLRVSHQR